MIQQRQLLVKYLAVFWDLIANGLGFYIAYKIKMNFLPHPIGGMAVDENFFSLIILAPPVFLFWGWRFHLFTPFRFERVDKTFLLILRTMALVIVSLLVAIFVFKLASVSRIFIFIYGIIAAIILAADKVLLQFLLQYFRKKGFYHKNALVVGVGKKTKQYIETINSHEIWGVNIIGLIDSKEGGVNKTKYGYTILGDESELRSILLSYPVDEVVCTLPLSKAENIQSILKVCEELGITARLISEFFETLVAKTHVEHLNGFPIITYSTTPNQLIPLIAKRIFDFVFSIIALVLFAPFFLIISALIKITSHGPVFFIQERMTLNGRRFKMLKFRTMVENAEESKVALAGINEMDGPVFKIKEDPRITKIGNFLRKSSLDEFPQFINVIKGEMSVVGPRPPVPEEVNNYQHWQRRRLSMRPGITCLWQISGRNNVGFDQWMKLDLEYIDNWSLWLDFKILVKTIPVVIFAKGAY